MKYISPFLAILGIITAAPALAGHKNVPLDASRSPTATAPKFTAPKPWDGDEGSNTMEDFADYMVAESWPNQIQAEQKSAPSTSTSPATSSASTPAKK